MEHVLVTLSHKYPQLLFPIAPGTSKTIEYRNAVYLGKKHNGILDYSLSEMDWVRRVDTPAGIIDILMLDNRLDFEKCVCALANRCEPKIIPETIGAFMISGLINWEKVRKYHGEQVMGDYYDRIILLSSGWYSGLAPEAVGLSNEDWLEKSVTIRMYHEIAHFVCRSRNPENTSVFRDEVFADMIGMVAAFRYYDTDLAKIFLGIHNTEISETARIRYYLNNRNEKTVTEELNFWISWLKNKIAVASKEIDNLIVDVFDEMLLIKWP